MTWTFCPKESSVIRPQSGSLKPFPSRLACSWAVCRAVLRFLYLHLTFSITCRALSLAPKITVGCRKAPGVCSRILCLKPYSLRGSGDCGLSEVEGFLWDQDTFSAWDCREQKPRKISLHLRRFAAMPGKTPYQQILSLQPLSCCNWDLGFLFSLKPILSSYSHLPCFLFQNDDLQTEPNNVTTPLFLTFFSLFASTTQL